MRLAVRRCSEASRLIVRAIRTNRSAYVAEMFRSPWDTRMPVRDWVSMTSSAVVIAIRKSSEVLALSFDPGAFLLVGVERSQQYTRVYCE